MGSIFEIHPNTWNKNRLISVKLSAVFLIYVHNAAFLRASAAPSVVAYDILSLSANYVAEIGIRHVNRDAK